MVIKLISDAFQCSPQALQKKCFPTFTFVLAPLYRLITAVNNASGIPFFPIAHSTTFLGPLSNAFSRSTKRMSNFVCLAKYSSCIHLRMKSASIVPLPGIKSNCMSSIATIFLKYLLQQFSLHVLVFLLHCIFHSS